MKLLNVNGISILHVKQCIKQFYLILPRIKTSKPEPIFTIPFFKCMHEEKRNKSFVHEEDWQSLRIPDVLASSTLTFLAEKTL